VKNPVNYPEYLAHKEDADEQLRKLARRRLYAYEIGNATESPSQIRQKRYSLEMELPPDVKLYAGFVFNSSPHRHKSSKFYVTLAEYPYAQWPSYVTAGCYIVSRSTLLGKEILYDSIQFPFKF
jgi:Galactosyltransferase